MAEQVRGLMRRLTRRLIQRGPAPAGRLVIHIGDFKTGSTAIQSWLATSGAAHGIGKAPGFNQADLAQLARDHADAVAAGATDTPADAAFAEIARRFCGMQDRFLVLSAEHFEMTPPAALATLLARHLPDLADTARIIAYIRPHPRAYLARLAESVRIGSHMGDVDSYLDRPDIPRRLAYFTRLRGWQEAFGPRLTVRLFDRASLPGGDIRRDFAAFVTGQDPGARQVTDPGQGANPTPGLRDLARARALHRALGDLPADTQGARFTIGRAFGRVLAQATDAAPDTPLFLSTGLAQRLGDMFAGEARQTDAAFFVGKPLSGALSAALSRTGQAAAALPPSLIPEDHLTPEAIAEIDRFGALLRAALLHPEADRHITALWHE